MIDGRGVICLWEWDAKAEQFHDQWVLLESYVIDMDGYPVCDISDINTFPQNIRNQNRQFAQVSWENFLFQEVGDDSVPIMGRATTVWDVEYGVRLLGLHPPEWSNWLSINFIDELKKLKNWSAFLEGGHTLHLGTAREVGKYLKSGE